jgi:serine/threonine protein kinase
MAFQVRTPKWGGCTFAAKVARLSRALSGGPDTPDDPELCATLHLDSQFIARIYDYFQHQDLLVLIVDYYSDGTLDDYLQANPEGIQPELQPSIFREIVDALRLCHEMQIPHRDIKPSNIFVCGNFHVKLGDFGLSLFASDLLHSRGDSPAYAAPEMYESGVVDLFKADIFSLGVTLFQLACGRLPYAPDDVLKMREIEWPEGFSVAFVELLKAMLARAPLDRPPIRSVTFFQCFVKGESKVGKCRPNTFDGFGGPDQTVPLVSRLTHARSALAKNWWSLSVGIDGQLRVTRVIGPSKLAGLLFRTPKRASHAVESEP